MVYTNFLLWFGGWFIIVIPNLYDYQARGARKWLPQLLHDQQKKGDGAVKGGQIS